MVDRDMILAKAGSVESHLKRVIEKRNANLQIFLTDIDLQESILFNLQMAIQNCTDIAAHIISEEGFGVPGSTNEMFYLLEENGYLDRTLTEKMVKATGFRNLIVHEYSKLDLKQVYDIAHKDIDNLKKYLQTILKRTGMENKDNP